MGFAGEHELDRHLRVVHQRRQPFQVLQDQVGSLVGGKAAGEADRQGIDAQRTAHLVDEFGLLAAAFGEPDRAAAGDSRSSAT